MAKKYPYEIELFYFRLFRQLLNVASLPAHVSMRTFCFHFGMTQPLKDYRFQVGERECPIGSYGERVYGNSLNLQLISHKFLQAACRYGWFPDKNDCDDFLKASALAI